MTAESESPSDPLIFVEILPSAEIDAGTPFAVTCRAKLPINGEYDGLAVSVRDHEDTELARVSLTQFEDDFYVSDEIALSAPQAAGEYIWRASLVMDGEEEAVIDNRYSTEFAIVAKEHAARLNIWDLPPAITAGERFTFKAGLKCSAGCRLSGGELRILNSDGVQVGAGHLHDNVWPGTSALYFADMEAEAPAAVGDHDWEVRVLRSESGVPHAAGVHTFTLKVVDKPDCEVTIEVRDANSHQPIAGARIAMHPYRAVTNGNGMAVLSLVKGDYKLLVSATKFMAVAQTVEVVENVKITIDLTLEPVDDPASFYV